MSNICLMLEVLHVVGYWICVTFANLNTALHPTKQIHPGVWSDGELLKSVIIIW